MENIPTKLCFLLQYWDLDSCRTFGSRIAFVPYASPLYGNINIFLTHWIEAQQTWVSTYFLPGSAVGMVETWLKNTTCFLSPNAFFSSWTSTVTIKHMMFPLFFFLDFLKLFVLVNISIWLLQQRTKITAAYMELNLFSHSPNILGGRIHGLYRGSTLSGIKAHSLVLLACHP